VLPLHGKNNQNGAGTPVNLLVFQYPGLIDKSDPAYVISTDMHLTHNMEIVNQKDSKEKQIYIGGKEGIGVIGLDFNKDSRVKVLMMPDFQGAGEIRATVVGTNLITTIEPMHGNALVVYTGEKNDRRVLDTTLSEGHALGTADILGMGYNQVVAGWRRPDKNGKVGVRIYSKKNAASSQWEQKWIDENGMACEDLQVMDLNGDGRLDIIASGRATHNLKIYWNRK
jgi:hypothetical protein